MLPNVPLFGSHLSLTSELINTSISTWRTGGVVCLQIDELHKQEALTCDLWVFLDLTRVNRMKIQLKRSDSEWMLWRRELLNVNKVWQRSWKNEEKNRRKVQEWKERDLKLDSWNWMFWLIMMNSLLNQSWDEGDQDWEWMERKKEERRLEDEKNWNRGPLENSELDWLSAPCKSRLAQRKWSKVFWHSCGSKTGNLMLWSRSGNDSNVSHVLIKPWAGARAFSERRNT